jgi:hypothetical protein
MKFLVDNKEVYEFTDTIKKVICNEVLEDIFVEDMERRVKYIVEHKYKQCLKRLKDEWEPRLKSKGIRSIPLDDDEFAQLVFQQSDYQDRKKREKERLKNV